MTEEAEELHRIISASVRDMLDAYRIQAQAGPVTDKALEEILFRAAHGVVQSLVPYPARRLAAAGACGVGPGPARARGLVRIAGRRRRGTNYPQRTVVGMEAQWGAP
jgi:hypothetical protein